MRRFLSTLILSFLVVLPASAAETIDAVWKEQKVEFTFQSLEIAYSCDVIQARVAMMLRHLGAANVEVTTPPCPGVYEPQMHHRVTATFSVLVPAAAGDVDTVKAAWTEVELGKNHPRPIDDSDCELLEHFQKYLLPAVEHEVIAGKARCGASRHAVVGRLKLKVLMPVVDETAAQQGEQQP